MVRNLLRTATVVTLLVGTAVFIPTVAEAAPIEDAVSAGAANAAKQGITSYISVVDRSTGTVASETPNAHTQVASESIVKLFIAGYYAVQAGGSDGLSAANRNRLEDMIKFSDDNTANSLFRSTIVPSQAARYGLTETTNDTDGAGHWGAVRITAHDMAKFMYAMSNDPDVGPWLLGVMAQVAPNGSDGFNQQFGFNALSGVHGSKQGWGGDGWGPQPYTINSVGFTDQWFGAILQSGTASTYATMSDTATFAAQQIQNAPKQSSDNPRGSVDNAGLVGFAMQLSGWASDPNDAGSSINVDIYDIAPGGGVTGLRITADQARPDVNSSLGIPGNHGWTAGFVLSGGGTHQICVYAINVGAGTTNPQLGCRSVDLSVDPLGTIDSASLDNFTYTVAGWAIDPDSPRQPLDVHIYDYRADGSSSGYPFQSGLARPDVAAAFSGAGDNQGYSATVRLTGGGVHQVCVYAINVGAGGNVTLGCQTVTTATPVGTVDGVLNPSVGGLLVQGWSLDPDVPTVPVGNTISVIAPDGTVADYSGYVADGIRGDVGSAFPGVGDNHGLVASVPVVQPGTSQVCVHALSARSPATSQRIGCRSVVVQNAFGTLDGVSAGAGSISVSGWALNPNGYSQAVPIDIYDSGPNGLAGYGGNMAGSYRPDVDAVFGQGADHGYVATIPAASGRHQVCAYAITTGGGTGNTLLGCREVIVG